MSQAKSASTSAFTPLKHPVFRALWSASLVSNIGTWLQNVGQAWLMTSLTSSPLVVALVQTADSLPTFLFSLPAGALADLVDRRRLLIATQAWMLFVALILGFLSLYGLVSWWLLLASTFAMSCGAALNGPAWQTTIPHVVPREELPNAITLNGIGFNLARVLGPALGGLVVATGGATATFFLNAVSFVGVIWVLFRWRSFQAGTVARAERVLGAIRSGLRYARHSTALQNVLIRAMLYPFFASAIWSLLPIFARLELKTGSAGYGLFLGSLGTGAVLAAVVLPTLRQRYSADRIVAAATLLNGGVLLCLATVRVFPILCLVMVFGGMSWMSAMSSFNVGVQIAVPVWVRARALSLYLLAFQGGMALGSVTWGAIASQAGISTSLAVAGIGLSVSLIFVRKRPLTLGEDLDLTPFAHASDPHGAIDLKESAGPVMVTIDYEIEPLQADMFKEAMERLGIIRRRDGAIQWGLYADSGKKGRYVETYLLESWADHLRQHDRVTVSDKKIERVAKAFHIGSVPPVVRHLIHAN